MLIIFPAAFFRMGGTRIDRRRKKCRSNQRGREALPSSFFAILVAKSGNGRIEVVSISAFTVLCYNKFEIDRRMAL